MASKDLRASGTVLLVLAATFVASCASPASGARSVRSAGYRASTRTAAFPRERTSRSEALRGYPAAFVAAVSRGIRFDPHGLAVFSASDGRLVRWLVRRAPDPVPVSVSPDGRWLYYYDQGTTPSTAGARPPVSQIRRCGGCRPRRPPAADQDQDARLAIQPRPDDGLHPELGLRPGHPDRGRNRRTGATRRIILAQRPARKQPGRHRPAQLGAGQRAPGGRRSAAARSTRCRSSTPCAPGPRSRRGPSHSA